MQAYITVGHVCIDELPTGTRLGGTVFFAAGQAAAMACDVRVVTACTDATATEARRMLPSGSSLDVAPADADTRFGYSADAELGPQRLISRAPVLEHVPEMSGSSPPSTADVLHLAPVFGELSTALVAGARQQPRFVGATPQGLLRGTAAGGALTFVAEHWPAGDFADAIVLNDAEYLHLAGIGLLADFGGWVFRTLGPAGAALLRDGEEVGRHAPDPIPGSVEPQRTIGAGDVFAAAAFVALARGDDPLGALEVAVDSASAYVRRPTDVPTFVDATRSAEAGS